MNRSDVLIVGSGLAGLTAALAAARPGAGGQSGQGRGLAVTLICKGAGSLAISGGCVDLLGYVNGKAVEGDPFDAFSVLPAEHPYALLGAAKVREALDFLTKLCAARDWPLDCATGPEGAPRNRRLPTVMGTLKPSFLCSASADPAPLETARHILVVGIEGVGDCQPGLIISQLRRYSAYADKQFSQVLLPSPFGTAHRRITPLDVARLVDAGSGSGFGSGLDWLVQSLKDRLGADLGGAEAVLLPPICGTRASGAPWRALCAALGRPVVEMLSIPPGVGGLRLRDVLLRALRERGVRLVENAVVCGAETAGRQCQALLTRAVDGVRRHEAQSFVLATGGIMGGGIEIEPGRARETVFALPLDVPADTTCWSEADIFGKHAFARLGVTVNGQLQPVDAQGVPVFDNVYFAGRSVGAYDFAAEKSGHGVALSTGYAAGAAAGSERHHGGSV